jgi:hypothetical protein
MSHDSYFTPLLLKDCMSMDASMEGYHLYSQTINPKNDLRDNNVSAYKILGVIYLPWAIFPWFFPKKRFVNFHFFFLKMILSNFIE